MYWQLTQLGVHCEVIAPSLVPTKSGDRIKTDRRDAERLARSYQAGDLTAVWVLDSKPEALRDLVRAREATKEDQLRAKHRLGKYLLRYSLCPSDDGRPWTAAWWQWVKSLKLPHSEQNATLLELILEVDHQVSASSASTPRLTSSQRRTRANCERSRMRCKRCVGLGRR